jgi:ATP-dependent Lon protease
MAMIIKSRKQLPLLASDTEAVLPVLPIRSGLIFPGEIHTIQVGRRGNLALFGEVTERDNLLVLSFAPKQAKQRGKIGLSQVGVLARVQSVKPAMSNSRMVTLEGLRRVALIDIKKRKPFIEASISELEDRPGAKSRLQEHISRIMDLVSSLIKIDDRYANEIAYTLEMNISVPGQFADRVASIIHLHLDDKQEVLEAAVVTERLEILIRLLNREIEKISLALQIKSRTTESLEQKKREVFLRQQLMEIRRELGEEFIEEDVARIYHNRIKDKVDLPREVAERLLFEANRVKHLSSSSNEYGATKNYLDLLLSLPWSKPAADDYDLVKVEKTIDAEYYGSSRIKEQVLEYLAVRQMSPDLQDISILCVTGAIGTGKASLVKAMAKAIDRQFVRINGTSLTMVEDIKGTQRTTIGAGPGQLVRAAKRAGSFDLVVFIEDLEYVVESDDSNALLALLEAIDPRHNSLFIDNFVGVPLDFSRILFVLGLSYFDDFPEPFLHRLEMVEMPGYIEREKITIAKKHILPKLYKRHGLTRTELKFSEKALSRIVRYYTMEAGIIGFQQQLEKIFRKITRKKASGVRCRYSVTEANTDEFLGTAQYIPEKATAKPEIGVATGLAWTGAGGDLMLIEGLKMKGTGQVIYTGSLGEVMKESVQAAHSFVRARAETLGIDHNDFVNFDIHIHFPMGAIPKDGPSAGVTVSLVVASVMAERPIRNDIAMTGEVTLRGKVLSVGGIREKVSAAFRAGIKNIVLPKENEKDIKDISKEIVRKTNFIFIESIDELFEKGLLGFTPSTYTLEKIFAAEIENAKKRNKSRGKRKSGRKIAKKGRIKSK